MGRSRSLDRIAPFFAALKGYVEAGIQPFHTPGHKQGRGAWPPFRRWLGSRALAIDLSDTVAHPVLGDDWEGALQAAERLAATLFGSRQTFFLTNGTSGGLHAAFWACAGPDETVVVPRASHLAVWGALAISGAQPVYVAPRFHPVLQVPAPPDLAAVEAVASRAPRPAALFFTRPDYYGLLPELPAAGDAGDSALRIVDEAHGPHFGFHPELPAPALGLDADVVVQSTHKVLGALTQASMLHIGPRPDPALIARSLRLLASTSPSPLLLASLDAATAQLAEMSRRLLARALELAWRARQMIGKLRGLVCYGPEALANPGGEWDPTRLVISVAGLRITGFTAARTLREAARVQVEMADWRHIIVLVTIGDTPETIDALLQALGVLVERAATGHLPIAADSLPFTARLPPFGQARMAPRQAVLAPIEPVRLAQSVGRIAAELVCPYPPGVPVLAPGEEVSGDVVEYLEALRAHRLPVRGPADPSLHTLLVIRGERT